jgi:hypothetical protein
MGFRLWHVPLRASAGAYILNSGVTKRQAPEAAEHLHGAASTAYPQVAEVPPERFATALSAGEIAVGGLLLTPVVPTGLAGLALTGYSGALLGLYLRSPGLTDEGGVRPTEEGAGSAKDVWLLGIGLALVLDAIIPDGKKKRKRGKRRRRRAKA